MSTLDRGTSSLRPCRSMRSRLSSVRRRLVPLFVTPSIRKNCWREANEGCRNVANNVDSRKSKMQRRMKETSNKTKRNETKRNETKQTKVRRTMYRLYRPPNASKKAEPLKKHTTSHPLKNNKSTPHIFLELIHEGRPTLTRALPATDNQSTTQSADASLTLLGVCGEISRCLSSPSSPQQDSQSPHTTTAVSHHRA